MGGITTKVLPSQQQVNATGLKTHGDSRFSLGRHGLQGKRAAPGSDQKVPSSEKHRKAVFSVKLSKNVSKSCCEGRCTGKAEQKLKSKRRERELSPKGSGFPILALSSRNK